MPGQKRKFVPHVIEPSLGRGPGGTIFGRLTLNGYPCKLYIFFVGFISSSQNSVRTALSFFSKFFRLSFSLLRFLLRLGGVDRLFLALLCSAYDEDEIDGEKRSLLRQKRDTKKNERKTRGEKYGKIGMFRNWRKRIRMR